jgi:23S rRNA (adenine2030-N6)-methyltransferase
LRTTPGGTSGVRAVVFAGLMKVRYSFTALKYRHSFHAGNFADVHKHVALLSLLTALRKKGKGFLYLDTHAGRGVYDLSGMPAEAAVGVGRFLHGRHQAPELRDFASLLTRFRATPARAHLYPGSPLIALAALRPQDRAVLIERQGPEVQALEAALAAAAAAAPSEEHRVRVERGDGYARLRAFLPPPERRGLTFIDPPYEETQEDFARVTAALAEGLRRFPTGVLVAWYPIKDERNTRAWHTACTHALKAALLVSELWLYPRDSRIGLNGSGLLIVNAPWQTLERMQVWLAELQTCLAVGEGGGSRAAMLSESHA